MVIDRRALLARHKVVITGSDLRSPLSVGNGEFCFTVDVTGLQTFDVDHRDSSKGAMPLTTMSDWGWHHKPNPMGHSWEKCPLTPFNSGGRSVDYLYWAEGKSPAALRQASEWLYADPNRLHLGTIGLILQNSEGQPATRSDLSEVRQELDLWTGCIASRFAFAGHPVKVTTVCHPSADQIAVTIESPLAGDGRLGVRFAFPYGSDACTGDGANWQKPDAHQTQVTRVGETRAEFLRTLDQDSYHVALDWRARATLLQDGAHEFRLVAEPGTQRITFTTTFSKTPIATHLADFEDTRKAAETFWPAFWSSGGAIDLSESSDPRWRELERRIVLSQYLTRIQSAGTLPPQETGLTSNSWFGKFHMEMYWWHAAHYALWGRTELLEKSMPFYDKILPIARKIAQDQGYRGVRWPKCVGPEGTPAPNYIEAFLAWQQPHPIFLAELCYRERPNRATLERYKTIVLESADFMGSFPTWDEGRQQYIVGPPITDAAEIYNDTAATNCNFNFENAYWHFGLEIAQRWRQRLGMPRDPHWDHILSHLPPLAIKDGVYVAGETNTDTWTTGKWSHPDVLGPLGMLDGAMVDHPIMRKTLAMFMETWDRPNLWGWDFPEAAMCAARLREGHTAIDALLMDTQKNTYLANGHNWQVNSLPLYLPGNGGLLYAVALMAAGWDRAGTGNAPGFPQDGTWVVKWEGLRPAPADYVRSDDSTDN